MRRPEFLALKRTIATLEKYDSERDAQSRQMENDLQSARFQLQVADRLNLSLRDAAGRLLLVAQASLGEAQWENLDRRQELTIEINNLRDKLRGLGVVL
jgi:hypothetical protein